MKNPNEPGSLSVSEAARRTGVNRRTVQRWVKAGMVLQYPMGTVDLADCLRCRARKRVGRKSKGHLRDNPLFWQAKENPAWSQAAGFMQTGKLDALQDMLVIIAFWHVQEGKTESFTGALKQVLQLTEKMHQGKRDDDPSWKAATGRYLNRRR